MSVLTYLNDIPYWATLSKPDFQTRVTSQAFVAWRRHERKAETALPPTARCQLQFDVKVGCSGAQCQASWRRLSQKTHHGPKQPRSMNETHLRECAGEGRRGPLCWRCSVGATNRRTKKVGRAADAARIARRNLSGVLLIKIADGNERAGVCRILTGVSCACDKEGTGWENELRCGCCVWCGWPGEETAVGATDAAAEAAAAQREAGRQARARVWAKSPATGERKKRRGGSSERQAGSQQHLGCTEVWMPGLAWAERGRGGGYGKWTRKSG